MTRIIAGRAGGRRLQVPARGTRPTSDRVREALFSALDARLDFDGMSVLDLYAGSGALGLEALSRGAATALFVESDARAAAVIERNIATVGLAGASVQVRKVGAVLAAGAGRPVDLVLADPPYDVATAEIDAVLVALDEGGWTASGTVVVVERRAGSVPATWPPHWSVARDRRYGDTRIELAERQ
jgi:16S rRNA (guanine966-N2)-methyltransferase